MDAMTKVERDIKTTGLRPNRSDSAPPMASMTAVMIAKPATDRLTNAKSAWNVAAMFGSDGKIMFTGNTARAESRIRVISRGGAAGSETIALPDMSVPGLRMGVSLAMISLAFPRRNANA